MIAIPPEVLEGMSKVKVDESGTTEYSSTNQMEIISNEKKEQLRKKLFDDYQEAWEELAEK